jgi:hypothetical protein
MARLSSTLHPKLPKKVKKAATSSHLLWNSARHSVQETPLGTCPALTRTQLGSKEYPFTSRFRFSHAISVADGTKILALNFKEVS